MIPLRTSFQPASVIACLIALSACGGDKRDGGVEPDLTDPVSIVVSPSGFTVSRGQSVTLSAEILDGTGGPVNERPNWRALDPEIARVDGNGVVDALTYGQGRIVVSIRALADTALVDVIPERAPGPPTIESLEAVHGGPPFAVEMRWAVADSVQQFFEILIGSDGVWTRIDSLPPSASSYRIDPAVPGREYHILVRAGNVLGATSSSVRVLRTPPLLVVDDFLPPPGEEGLPFSRAFTKAGGGNTVEYSLASGALPPGLSLGEDGVEGTPTEPGQWQFEIGFTDGLQAGTAPGRIDVEPMRPRLGDLPALEFDRGAYFEYELPFNQAVTSSYTPTGMARPDTRDEMFNRLPPGVYLDATGRKISGAAQLSGRFSFDVRYFGADGADSTRIVNLYVRKPGPQYFQITPLIDDAFSWEQQLLIFEALERWAEIISEAPTGFRLLGDQRIRDCNGFSETYPDSYYLAISFRVGNLPDPIVGRASRCLVRGRSWGKDNNLPQVGHIVIDPVALDYGAFAFLDLITHEIGHIMGIGSSTRWDKFIELANDRCGRNMFFRASNARREYEEEYGGSGWPPVDSSSRQLNGTACAHWREGMLPYEVMISGNYGPGGLFMAPISGITVGALDDMGWRVYEGFRERIFSGNGSPLSHPSGDLVQPGPVVVDEVLPAPTQSVRAVPTDQPPAIVRRPGGDR